MTQVTHKGQSLALEGSFPQLGEEAPDFSLIAQDLSSFSLQDFGRKIKVVLAVPSLDTPVCAQETRTFYEKLASKEEAALIVVSGDLPFAMKRFCTTAGLSNIFVGSQFQDMRFSKSYGTHIREGLLKGLSARAVFVIDQNNKIAYAELVPDIASEPDYDKALAALDDLGL